MGATTCPENICLLMTIPHADGVEYLRYLECAAYSTSPTHAGSQEYPWDATFPGIAREFFFSFS